MAIKNYHTGNGILNNSEFMENMLNKHQQISLSGAGASHQNGSSERTINMVDNIERRMLMHAEIICPKDTLSTDFGQWKWNILYGYTLRSMI